MLVYENLEDFMKAIIKAEDKTVYMKENKIFNNETGILNGEIIIQFYDNGFFHTLHYTEEIKPLLLVQQKVFDIVKVMMDEETSKKLFEKYQAKVNEFNDQLKKQKEFAIEALKKANIINIIEGEVIE